MSNKWLPISLSAIVLIAMGALGFMANSTQLSAYGTLLGAAGSILAVIWFTSSLWYQAQQLREQRGQFLAQFHHLRESTRRGALLTAKNILDAAESRAISHHGGITSTSELTTEYMNFSALKPILESRDPEVVLTFFQEWMKTEGAAMALLKGIKSAAEVYLNSIGIEDVDYAKCPEEFVFIYGPHFMDKPFFDVYQGTANLLAQFMFRLQPGRKSAEIAFFAATAKSAGGQVVRVDKVREDIDKHRENGYSVPAIAEDL